MTARRESVQVRQIGMPSPDDQLFSEELATIKEALALAFRIPVLPCGLCHYQTLPHIGHCYMFHEPPAYPCAQWRKLEAQP